MVGRGLVALCAVATLLIALACGGSSSSGKVEKPDAPSGSGNDSSGGADNNSGGDELNCEDATAQERQAWSAYLADPAVFEDEGDAEVVLDDFLNPLPAQADLDGYREMAENQEEEQREIHLAAIKASEVRLGACE